MSSLLNVSEENFQAILGICGLVHTTKNGKFQVKADDFTLFFTTFGLTADACEMTRTKRNASNYQLYIRLGNKDKAGTPDPGVVGWGPRIRNLSKLRSKFRSGLLSSSSLFQAAEVEKQLLTNDEAKVSEETAKSVQNDSYSNHLLIIRIMQRLLPLFINAEVLLQPNLLLTEQPIDKIKFTLLELTAEIQQHKSDELTAVLGTKKLPLSPTTKYNPKFCPTLRHYGIPLDDPRLQQALLTDLYQWNKKHNRTTTLHTNLGDNKMSSFVLIPSSKDVWRLHENKRWSKWIVKMLEAMGGPGHEEENLLNLLLYVGRFDTYQNVWEAAVEMNGVPMPKLDGVTTFAVQSMCNLNKTQMRMLLRCLRAEIGSPLFSTEFSIQQVLGSESIALQTGTYKYGSERVNWSYKSLKEAFTLWLESELKEGKYFQHLDVVISIDHGKGHSRATTMFVG